MNKKSIILACTVMSFLLTFHDILFAGLFGSGSDSNRNKIIYVRDFTIEEGITANNSIKSRIKEIIQEVFQQDSRYQITADEDIAVTIEQEEKALSIAKCNSEACIRKLMDKINAEVIIFGRVRRIDGFTYITARHMDRSKGMPRVSKIRTIKYRYNEHFEKGALALGKYLLTGDNDYIADFMDEVYTREENDRYLAQSTDESRRIAEKERQYQTMVKEAAIERRNQIMSRSPVVRFGYGFYHNTFDADVNKYYTDQSSYFVDFIARTTDTVPEPLKCDFYTRLFHKRFRMNDSSVEQSGLVGKDVVSPSKADMFGLDLGFRFRTGSYFMLTSFDLYCLFAGRYQYYHESAKDPLDNDRDIEITIHSFGGYVGAGIEMAFFENLGLFVEYNIGYTPVGESKINFEGHQFYGGLTLRTEIPIKPSFGSSH